MAFNASDILNKAKQKTAEEKQEIEKKAAEEAAKLEEQKRAAQREREEAEKQRKAEEEAFKARQKQQEQEAAERAAEQQRQLELEKARIQEQVKQQALAQKTAATQKIASEMQDVLSKSKNVLSNKKASTGDVQYLISKSNTLLNNDVFYENISCLEEFKQNLNELNNKKYSLEKHQQNKAKAKKTVLGVILGIVGVVLLFFIFRGITVAAHKPKGLKVGDKGEAGIIFYDKGEYSNGWRYLEVGMKNLAEGYWAKDTKYSYMEGLKGGLGEGDFNTKNIIGAWGEDTAAGVAASYDGGGKNDWYLPNRAEMQLVYKNLHKKDKSLARKYSWDRFTFGIFDSGPQYYWTSEMSGKGKACTVHTGSLGGEASDAEMYTYEFVGSEYYAKERIRPIRKF